jgi:GNAT superfamily N-acetyltransferase
MSPVKIAERDADIRRCFAVMRQLRPHLHDEADFLVRARRQMGHERWQLIYVEDDSGVVAAVSGFRILECLSSGKTLYVDDLVTAEDQRGKRYGETLMAWMEQRARDEGCETFSLDSGTQRTGAHKFYFRLGLPITSFHFAKKL